MKKYGLAILAACVSFLVIPAHADKLTGTFVSATLTVDGSPAFVSNTFNSGPVSIGAGTEFSATTEDMDGTTPPPKPKTFTFNDEFTANFTNGVDIDNEICTNGVPKGQTGGCDTTNNPNAFPGFTMTFTDTAFLNADLNALNDPTGYTYNLSGDVLTVTYAGGSNPDGNFRLNIDPTQPNSNLSSAPEPQSLALLGTGMLSAFAMARRRLFA